MVFFHSFLCKIRQTVIIRKKKIKRNKEKKTTKKTTAVLETGDQARANQARETMPAYSKHCLGK